MSVFALLLNCLNNQLQDCQLLHIAVSQGTIKQFCGRAKWASVKEALYVKGTQGVGKAKLHARSLA